MLETRERACEEINKMFGLDIKVSKRNNLKIDLNSLDDYEEGEL